MKSTTRRFWVIFLLVTLVTLVALAPARAFAAAAYPPGGPYFLYERDKGTSAADSFDYGVKLTDNKYANTVLVYGGYRIENSTSGGHHLWEIYDSDGLVGTIETSNGGGYCDVTVVAGKELVIRSQDNNGNHVVYKYFLFVGEISEPVRLADSANDFWLMMHSAPKAPDPIYEYTIEKLVSASQPDSAGLSATGWEKEVTVIKGESAWYKLTINARLTNGTGTANEPGATGADSISVWLRDPILGINNQEVVFTKNADGSYSSLTVSGTLSSVMVDTRNVASIYRGPQASVAIDDDYADVVVRVIPDPVYSYQIVKEVSAVDPASAGFSQTNWKKSVTIDQGADAWYKVVISGSLDNGGNGVVGAPSLTVRLVDEKADLIRTVTLYPTGVAGKYEAVVYYKIPGIMRYLKNTALIYDPQGNTTPLGQSSAEVFIKTNYEYAIVKKVTSYDPDGEGFNGSLWQNEVTVNKGTKVWFKITVTAKCLVEDGDESLRVLLVDEMFDIEEWITLEKQGDSNIYEYTHPIISMIANARCVNVAEIFGEDEAPLGKDDATVRIYNPGPGDDDNDADGDSDSDTDSDSDRPTIPDTPAPKGSLPSAPDATDILDDVVPLGNLPRTGVGSLASAGIGLLFSGLAGLFGTLSSKKKRK